MNMNAEAPRFGIMKAKKDTSRRMFYGLCDPTDIREKTLLHNHIRYEALSRDRNHILNERRLIDIQIVEQLSEDQKEAFATVCGYENVRNFSDVLNPTNNKAGDYYYTSVWGLIKAIMHGQNTGPIKDYAGFLMTIIEIYNVESKAALAVAYNRTLITNRISNGLKSQWIVEKDDKIDQLLAKADQIIDQNVDLKGHIIEIKSDVKTLINVFNNTACSPRVVKQIIELHGGANNNGSFTIDGDKPWEHVAKCKLVLIGYWFNKSNQRLIPRFACCNFNTVSMYYKDMEKFLHEESLPHGHVIEYKGTFVVSLYDQDINAEFSVFEPVLLSRGARKLNNKSKTFEVLHMDESNVDAYMNSVVADLRNAFSLKHQSGINKLLEDDSLSAEQRRQIVQIQEQNALFNVDAINWCQMFVSGCVDYLHRGKVVEGDRIAFPRMASLPKTHHVEGTDWRAMDILKYAMTMFKLSVREFSLQEFIRDIIKHEMEN